MVESATWRRAKTRVVPSSLVIGSLLAATSSFENVTQTEKLPVGLAAFAVSYFCVVPLKRSDVTAVQSVPVGQSAKDSAGGLPLAVRAWLPERLVPSPRRQK
jgi:hypothetical protein